MYLKALMAKVVVKYIKFIVLILSARNINNSLIKHLLKSKRYKNDISCFLLYVSLNFIMWLNLSFNTFFFTLAFYFGNLSHLDFF